MFQDSKSTQIGHTFFCFFNPRNNNNNTLADLYIETGEPFRIDSISALTGWMQSLFLLEAKNLGTYQELQQRRGRWEEEEVLGGRYFFALPAAAAAVAVSAWKEGREICQPKGREEKSSGEREVP